MENFLHSIYSDSKRLTARRPRSRSLRMETLEERDLLNVAPTEYAEICAAYPELNLPNEYGALNICEIPADSLTCDALRAAIDAAGSTREDDLIVLRTTPDSNVLRTDGNPIRVAIDPEYFGRVTIVAYSGAPNIPLTVDTNGYTRAFAFSSSDVGLANISISGARAPFAADAEYAGLIRLHRSTLRSSNVSVVVTSSEETIDEECMTVDTFMEYNASLVETALAAVDSSAEDSEFEIPSIADPAPYGGTFYDTSLYMLGDVRITLVLFESDGSIDVNACDWTEYQIDTVKKSVRQGLDWWESLFDKYCPDSIQDLTFTIDYQYADSPVETSYEPIKRTHSDESLWVGDFLHEVGYTGTYTSSQSHLNDVRRFNESVRVQNDADWALSIFVVNSRNATNGRINAGKFTDGYFAYTWRGGPATILTYDCNGWGISRMPIVVAHETAHAFWALDEYSNGNYTDYSGYYHIQNYNAENNCTPGFTQQPSILATSNVQINAFPRLLISDSARETIGWRDSDGDGIFDAIDLDMELYACVGTYDETDSIYSFSGASRPVALRNLIGSYSSGNDVTIDRVDVLEYRIDGGEWELASCYGTVGAVSVSASVETQDLDVGTHTIDWRTYCLSSGVSSNLYSDSFEIGLSSLDAPIFTVESFDATSALALIESVPYADSYTLEYSTDESFANATVLTGLDAGVVVIVELTPETTYYVRVKAVRENDLVSEWTVASVQTLSSSNLAYPRLDSPEISLYSSEANTISVTIEAVENASQYSLEYSTDPNFASYTTVELDEPGVFTTPALSLGSIYYFRARAFADDAEPSLYSETKAVATSVATYAIPGSFTRASATTVDVGWSQISGADGYVVQYSSNPTFATSRFVSSSNNFCTLSGVASGSTCYIRVCAVGDFEAAAWSETISVVSGLLETPTLTLSDVGETELTATFSSVQNATTYTVQYSQSSDFSDSQTQTFSSGSPARVIGLTPGTTYYFRASASAASYVASEWSAAESATTEELQIRTLNISFSSSTPKYNVLYRTTVSPNRVAPTYQWYRGTGDGEWTAISGATNANYVPTTAEIGYYLKVVAQGTGSYSSYYGEAVSETIVTRALTSISITQNAKFQYLVRSYVVPSDATVTYQWYSGSEETGWTPISGATGANYAPTAAEVGSKLLVVATGVGAYAGVASKSTLDVVVRPLVSVALTARTDVGIRITSYVSPGIATATYQWSRSLSANSGFVNIEGATNVSYTPQAEDRGYYLKATVVGTGAYVGTVEKTTKTAVPLAPDSQDEFFAQTSEDELETFEEPFADELASVLLF